MQTETTTVKKRYYTDDNKVNPALTLAPLARQVHALFTYWVAANYATHDFIEAMAHLGDMFVIDYMMAGQPDCSKDAQPELVLKALAAPNCLPVTQTPERFYTAEGNLSYSVDDSAHRPALAAYFVRWVADGCHARDFTQALRDCAATVVYDYNLCKDFAGLGGGQTAEQFLTTTYKP